MEAFKTLIMIIGGFASIAVIGLVLMQQGKGADAGAAFGTGSAQGVFGSAGSANFLSRSTAIAATVFFCCCLALSIISSKQGSGNKLGLDAPAAAQHHAPAASQPAAASQPVIPE
ncbi:MULTISPECIES: preprotein translocase subunit SecG [Eikenella]|jgi:preprotein translocase, secG subunit|uniref:Protein-export membrane protein SecG n=1 Tax=Eikenella corrodens CC92I TaxID=1073362 RepID=V7IDG4_EIKCO|nr:MULTISPECIES: preprotein translocase subunit SecG [Eikenella]ETA83923.1 preprotein translocase, SecG subunit [Eikenella corrodens CC92I]OAM32977.1 preprotein translocase subunit SecG [Eikenella corrodens]OFK89290.1 preprotein translocase subunit SecG [Eikenella sp. HMSC071B05]OFN62671.1 preprotein translocase subunit SecG [Eikenella sp. HMSC061C02]OFO46968.1 preprotein translocase subunit SecG [Eikenella sp. HMSC073A11]